MRRITLILMVLTLYLGALAGQGKAAGIARGLLPPLGTEMTAPVSAPGYALAAIRNTTGDTVTYYYWWGNSNWDNVDMNTVGTVTLLPGATHYYTWTYGAGEAGSAPPLHIAFLSYTTGRNDGFLKTYTLPTSESPVAAEEYYARYHFGWGRNGRLDLFKSL